ATGPAGATGAAGTDGPHTGGINNTYTPPAFIGGGVNNAASGYYATVGGGYDNTASGNFSTVGGGDYNEAAAVYTTVGGGRDNYADGLNSTIGGGRNNDANGAYATVPGGWNNAAFADNSFAAGRRAKANQAGSFVWGDSFNADKFSQGGNSFSVYASGGMHVFTNTLATTGVEVLTGGGSWQTKSDRNSKEHFADVDARAVLEAVAALPITTWNYKAQDDSIRHMGPMAQDFRAAFGLGHSETMIATIDPDGVALAAIQGLSEVSNERDEELAARLSLKDAEIAELRAALDAMAARLAELSRRVETDAR
ncbi:MAG: tail fiber domain-containing protein, partial [Planctomycetota bacterium]